MPVSDWLNSVSDIIELPSEFVFEGIPETRGRPRTHFPDRAATGTERKDASRGYEAERRKKNIAVLDFETDPFDKEKPDHLIYPFAACLYSRNFEPVVIWDEDFTSFVEKVIAAIEALPEPYTIFAHNGGKFDFMFLIHKIRGKVSFKGRGIMSCKIGPHELRDSFHIIPEKLAAYQKEEFDYTVLTKKRRNKFRDEIIRYMVSDCVYLLDIVLAFVERFGLKISIGQAAMTELKKSYDVSHIGTAADDTLRQFFFGGRVECLAGKGHFKGHYKLYDVNSMYPAAMAQFRHPISSDYIRRTRGGIGPDTIFVELECENFGALVTRDGNNETSALVERGSFKTTIWEYKAALELGLINRVKIKAVIDCKERSDFSLFVNPTYEARQETKTTLKKLASEGRKNSAEYIEAKKDDIFLKLLLNNAYGKFAQNPKRFKESYITEPGEKPPEGYEDVKFPHFENEIYAIWQRPAPHTRFNNVGTAASITGAARSILMRAIAGAVDPIYCDTDSLICKSISGVEIDPVKLGAWDLEAEYSEVIVLGKKLYSCKPLDYTVGQEDEIKVRSKGVSGLTWDHMERMLRDEVVTMTNRAPTLEKTGRQYYMTRQVRATAKPRLPRQRRKAA